MRPTPLTSTKIKARSVWPEIVLASVPFGERKALAEAITKLREPDQHPYNIIPWRRKLMVGTAPAEAFLSDLENLILGYRIDKLLISEEKPRDRAESMKRLIDAYEAFLPKLLEAPLEIRALVSTSFGLLEPAFLIPTGTPEWEECKKRVTEAAQQEISPQASAQRLKNHAEALQRLACEHDQSLQDNWDRLKLWLAKALAASEETVPKKNKREAYFDALMLPKRTGGGVDLFRAKPTLRKRLHCSPERYFDQGRPEDTAGHGNELKTEKARELEARLNGVLF